MQEFASCITKLHGEEIQKNRHFVRMVHDAAFERVSGYLHEGVIAYGGHTDPAERFIEPTLLDQVPENADILRTEIFGPVFPLITFDDSGEGFENKAVKYINDREKPLALYYFGKEADGWHIVGRTSSGGCCLNDTIMHVANSNLPFGGVGNSGMGHYHGKLTFEAFTHRRSVVASPTLFDLPFRYMPYKTFKMQKRFL